MKKYYVSSGSVRFVGMATDEITAIGKAINTAKKTQETVTLGQIVVVSERGFDSLNPNDMIFSTTKVLQLISK